MLLHPGQHDEKATNYKHPIGQPKLLNVVIVKRDLKFTKKKAAQILERPIAILN